jgi:hypothetical protein
LSSLFSDIFRASSFYAVGWSVSRVPTCAGVRTRYLGGNCHSNHCDLPLIFSDSPPFSSTFLPAVFLSPHTLVITHSNPRPNIPNWFSIFPFYLPSLTRRTRKGHTSVGFFSSEPSTLHIYSVHFA